MTKIITVAGGKGGTGKTTVAVNLSYLLSKRGKTILVDADVENPCVPATIAGRIVVNRIVEVKGFKPVFDYGKCVKCGLCVEKCPEHSLTMLPSGRIIYFETLCSGCSSCMLVCPANAISEGYRLEGLFRFGRALDTMDVIVGEIVPGNRRSGVLIARLIEENLENFRKYDFVVIDSPPGTFAGVYSTIKHAETILAVTEPTPLGVNDLRKFIKLARKYGKEDINVVVNKYGIPGGSYEEIERIVEELGLRLFKIPYSRIVFDSVVRGVLVVEEYPESDAAKSIERLALALS